ncbi:hypothetical protein HanRHA438_Chr08g0346771 [Helianthus annuus]|nr:hypothetical protein HanIR_Chr08g0362121 [Helianthus annuus]KAJ0897533.1 hypothetical protein HanRHA438_Chr08g0346771 [Helianthus annuus]
MDAQEWNESLARIESMIVEIINFLKNRTRLPPLASPPAVAATAPHVPSPASTTTSETSPEIISPIFTTISFPCQKASVPTHHMNNKVVPKPAFKQTPSTTLVQIPKTTPSPEHFAPSQHPNSKLQTGPNTASTHVISPPMLKTHPELAKGQQNIKRRRSRGTRVAPPWRFASTYQNANRRTEWRPLGASRRPVRISSLRTRMF